MIFLSPDLSTSWLELASRGLAPSIALHVGKSQRRSYCLKGQAMTGTLAGRDTAETVVFNRFGSSRLVCSRKLCERVVGNDPEKSLRSQR